MNSNATKMVTYKNEMVKGWYNENNAAGAQANPVAVSTVLTVKDPSGKTSAAMEISRKTDYTIRLVVALMQNEGKPLSVREAAEQQGVPYSLARSIQHDLVKSGVVTTVRGAQGGMTLAVDPNDYTLTHLIETVQGPLAFSTCQTREGWCPRDKNCVFHKVWCGASEVLRNYLSSVTIKELLEGKTPVYSSKHDKG